MSVRMCESERERVLGCFTCVRAELWQPASWRVRWGRRAQCPASPGTSSLSRAWLGGQGRAGEGSAWRTARRKKGTAWPAGPRTWTQRLLIMRPFSLPLFLTLLSQFWHWTKTVPPAVYKQKWPLLRQFLKCRICDLMSLCLRTNLFIGFKKMDLEMAQGHHRYSYDMQIG